MVLTSRPANTLSSGASIRIVRLLGELGTRRNIAAVIIARRDNITGRAGGVMRVGSNMVNHVRRGLSRATHPFNVGNVVGWERVHSVFVRVLAAVGRGHLHATLANFSMT